MARVCLLSGLLLLCSKWHNPSEAVEQWWVSGESGGRCISRQIHSERKAASQWIWAGRHGQANLPKFKLSIRKKTGELSDTEHDMIVGARQAGLFKKLLVYWDFVVDASLQYGPLYLRNVSSNLLNLCHEVLKHIWRQKGVQPREWMHAYINA